MMERWGYEEFLDELRPVVLDNTEEGRLLQVTVPGEQTPFLLMDVRDHTRGHMNPRKSLKTEYSH